MHLVAAYAHRASRVLAERGVREKEAELTVAPEVLKGLDLKGLVVTGNALLAHGDCARRPWKPGEPVLDLRGFDHRFLHSYTFPSCLPDPGRLVVPTRAVVIRAAPILPCVSRVRLPSASGDRCDGLQEGLFHPLTVIQRLVAHDGLPEDALSSAGDHVPAEAPDEAP